jgi:hypothetical protein
VRRRELLRGAAAAALVAGFGAGCSEPPPPGATNVVDPGTPAPSLSPTPTTPAAPLSGLPASSEAVAGRPALAVPLRVTKGTTPVGLPAADIIFQEYAESDSLHLTAVFQSRDASRIGPVTEVRPVDVRTLGVMRPFVAYDGGPTGFLAQFADAGLKGVTPAAKSAPFSGAYTSTAGLYKLAPTDGPPPSPIFDYATVGTPLAESDVAPAAELSVAVPGQAAQVWRYDEKTNAWLGQAGKTTIAAASVLVLTMEYRTIDVRKPSYRVLPSAKVFGEGAATVVSGPFAAKAKWRKPGQRLLCNVLDLAGNQVHPQPGVAWVVYAPPKAKVTTK